MSQTEPEWAQRAKFLQSLMSVNQDKNGEIFKTLLKVISAMETPPHEQGCWS